MSKMTPLDVLRSADAGGGLMALLALREYDDALWAALREDPAMLAKVRDAAETYPQTLGYVLALRRALYLHHPETSAADANGKNWGG